MVGVGELVGVGVMDAVSVFVAVFVAVGLCRWCLGGDWAGRRCWRVGSRGNGCLGCGGCPCWRGLGKEGQTALPAASRQPKNS